ncbi:MAG: hypothetical protein II051_03225 [Lachnospiraceae bacterium]|nr:hypothetical protein [Lachnospiraceae bacterium]MBQ2466952.1 hypothetical protein [Lachnospiraceae bacterium]
MRRTWLLVGMSMMLMLSVTACGSKTENAAEPQTPDAEPVIEEPATEEPEAEESDTGLANPWTESDREGVLAATGFDLNVPDDAENVVYSYMEADKLAQVSYVMNDHDWTYRVQPTDGLQDISGMYYEWVAEEDTNVADCEAEIKAYVENNGDPDNLDDMFSVQVLNWYDATEGATHSVSISGRAVDGLDLSVYAEDMWMNE